VNTKSVQCIFIAYSGVRITEISEQLKRVNQNVFAIFATNFRCPIYLFTKIYNLSFSIHSWAREFLLPFVVYVLNIRFFDVLLSFISRKM